MSRICLTFLNLLTLKHPLQLLALARSPPLLLNRLSTSHASVPSCTSRLAIAGVSIRQHPPCCGHENVSQTQTFFLKKTSISFLLLSKQQLNDWDGLGQSMVHLLSADISLGNTQTQLLRCFSNPRRPTQ